MVIKKVLFAVSTLKEWMQDDWTIDGTSSFITDLVISWSKLQDHEIIDKTNFILKHDSLLELLKDIILLYSPITVRCILKNAQDFWDTTFCDPGSDAKIIFSPYQIIVQDDARDDEGIRTKVIEDEDYLDAGIYADIKNADYVVTEILRKIL